MFTTETQVRVRYAETDRMGYSYYANYAIYFEVARVEALRTLGVTYLELEDSGVLLPVVEYHIRFLRPAYYDDLLSIRTTIPALPTGRLSFRYETYRGDELLNRGSTDLVFVDKASGKPIRCPEHVSRQLAPYFKK